MTELIRATEFGDLQKVKRLLKKGAKPDAVNDYGWTALHTAANYGEAEILEEFLMYFPEMVDTRELYKKTSLHVAAEQGHLSAVEILLKYKAAVLTREKDGKTAIHYASINGHSKIVSRLLQCLPSEEEEFLDNLLTTLLTFSVEGDHWDTVKVLLKFGAVSKSNKYENRSTFDYPMAISDSDDVIFNKKLSFFLACLFAKDKDVMARWTWSQLKVHIAKWHENRNMNYQGKSFSNEAPIYYLRPNKRRQAIKEMRRSIEGLNDLVKDAIDWSSDVIPFINDRLMEIEDPIPVNEIIYLLLLYKYHVDEENKELLRNRNMNPLMIHVKSSLAVHIHHTALIYFNTWESQNRLLFQEHMNDLSRVVHPNILGYKESIKDESNSIIILRSGANYISLENLVAQSDDYLSQVFILTVFKQIALSVVSLHNKSVIHCSVKPTNIFIDDLNNCTRIGDLSSAVHIQGSRSTASLRDVLTKEVDEIYSAPEIRGCYKCGFIDVSSDIWSMGCVLFKMITRTNYSSQCNDLSLIKRSLKEKTNAYSEDFIEEIFELLEKMITSDVSQRITSDNILTHPLFRDIEVPSVEENVGFPSSENLVGVGGFGNVEQHGECAVKEAHAGYHEFLEHEKEIISYLEATAGRLGNVVIVMNDSLQSPYLMTEFCDKGSLNDVILSRGQNPFTMLKFVSYAYQMTRAVKYLHDMNIVHRDIKPANFVVNSRDLVKMIDFGLSVVLPPGTKCTGTVGTINYMAPEVILGEEYDRSADIYSLGAVFYELLTLRSLYGDLRDGRYREFSCSDCSIGIINLTNSMLHSQYEDRLTIEIVEYLVAILGIEEFSNLLNEVQDLFNADETNLMVLVKSLTLWKKWKEFIEGCEGFLLSISSYTENMVINTTPDMIVDKKIEWLRVFGKLAPRLIELIELLKTSPDQWNQTSSQAPIMVKALDDWEPIFKELIASWKSIYPESNDVAEKKLTAGIQQFFKLMKEFFLGDMLRNSTVLNNDNENSTLVTVSEFSGIPLD